ncbi:methyltransferase domain-containing protein [Streptomonospora sp. S1-112]|uniref:Protein-L-isoaspartate O-methyltransferase n=1 Tax=Streptomonospora mangrovi TaxID=2883123 RepID=A0A9X3SFX7_9ACTN|nr:rRNA adenine N-6-methyltransferase family protein [Streptomonospora mangrovi]MDA0566352.1 methyltransferase domain-containing protein [Streptomonospora mangrovi]
MTAPPPGLALARLLAAKGAVQDPAWHRAVLAVDRLAFIPDTVWVPDPDNPGWDVPVTSDDPDYHRWAADDYALVTQVDDGHPTGSEGRGRVPSSSISQPSLVMAMLQAMDVRDGDTVLEIGTGTGYSTALLCERLGNENVVSVEVDPGVAERARATLHGFGYKPRLVVGDGAHPPEGVYDRVIATVAARRVPGAWIAQTRPGGTVVIPWGPGFTSAGLLRLAVGDGMAQGRMIADAAFMWLRDQRRSADPWHTFVDEHDPATVAGHTRLNPRVVADRDPGWGVVLGWRVPGLAYASFEADPDNHAAAGEATVYVYDRDGSWALGEYVPAGEPYETLRAGPRDLWAEIAAAREVWRAAGAPGRDRLGLTVTAEGEHTLWVDTPGHVIEPGPLGGG